MIGYMAYLAWLRQQQAKAATVTCGDCRGIGRRPIYELSCIAYSCATCGGTGVRPARNMPPEPAPPSAIPLCGCEESELYRALLVEALPIVGEWRWHLGDRIRAALALRVIADAAGAG